MRERIDALLNEYEQGGLTREEFTRAIETLTAGSAEPCSSSVFQGRTLNHVTLKVSDLERSRSFYQEMFGLPVTKRTRDGYIFGLGTSFLGIYSTNAVGVDHFCLGIDGYEFDSVMELLASHCPTLKRHSRDDRAFVHDPDGIRIQLSAVDYPGA
jgi:catechol 2,3-dioxygenase-like lactoylglutathione lyase family enzyme